MKMPWEDGGQQLTNKEIDEIVNGERVSKPKSKKHAERSCRLDLRLTVAEKNKLLKKAAAGRRTVTSVIVELIEGMR